MYFYTLIKNDFGYGVYNFWYFKFLQKNYLRKYRHKEQDIADNSKTFKII